jgi:hypothetical protein
MWLEEGYLEKSGKKKRNSGIQTHNILQFLAIEGHENTLFIS